MRAAGGRLRRFESAEIDPESAVSLDADHPAVVEGRTIFPSTVVPSRMSPRFMVSGINSAKIGKMVTKGDRAGWPIYVLTLEERATCPRSCEQWRSCYGSAMHLARRHAVDEDFLFLLKAEVVTLARQHDAGFLVRLHALGDFYSVEYVETWGKLLKACPSLHVWGYTARTPFDADPESVAIAEAIQAVIDEHGWERFAVRTSTSTGWTWGDDRGPLSRSIVVDEDPLQANTIVCPEQTGQTQTCGTCGLCWSPNARDKTIAFLRHGMKRTRTPQAGRSITEPDKPSWASWVYTPDPTPRPHAQRLPPLVPLKPPVGETPSQAELDAHNAAVRAEIKAALSGRPPPPLQGVVTAVSEETLTISVQPPRDEVSVARAKALSPLPENQRELLAAFRAQADDRGMVHAKVHVISDIAGLHHGQWTGAYRPLIKRGYIEVLEEPTSSKAGRWKVLP